MNNQAHLFFIFAIKEGLLKMLEGLCDGKLKRKK
jgi:hypothetical protein